MGRPRPVAQRENRAGQRAARRDLRQRDKPAFDRINRAAQQANKALIDDIARLRSQAEGVKSPREIMSLSATERLCEDTRVVLNDMSKIVADEARKGETAGITIGRNAAIGQLDTVAAAFNRPSVETVRMLINYVDSPQFQANLAQFGSYYANHISDIILTDSTMGKGVNAIVRHIVQHVTEMPRFQAQVMVRTVTLYSARRASHQVYRENSDIVSGWRWSASLDRRVCMSCVVQHGKVFPLNQTLNDHHQGRCAPVPITRFTGGVKPGVEWFNELSDSEQQTMMGRSAYRAWRDGAIKLDQLSTTHYDAVYGEMRGEASLTSLIGADAAGEYAAA